MGDKMFQNMQSEKIRKTRKAFDDNSERQKRSIADKQRKNSRKEKQQTRYSALTGE